MKNLAVAVLGALLVSSIAIGAEESLTANLTLSSTIGAQCTPSVGKGLRPIIWRGVKDKRSVSAVGILKKGDKETDVGAAEPVEKLLEQGLRTMFEKCGYTIASGANANGIHVSVNVDEFFAGSKKGLIMGETEAKGSMTVSMTKGGRSVDLQFDASAQDKGLRKKNIKKLESTLSDLLATMINKVASTNQFSEAMKDLSK